MSTPVIFIPREPEQLAAAHDFHLKSVGEFLLPRSLVEFDKYAADGELWVAAVNHEIIASCYVTRGDDAHPAEFGGIILREDFKGRGLASAIGMVAIAAHYLHDPSPLIAHVHVDNQAPLDLLQKRLGFQLDPQQPVSIVKAELEKDLRRTIEMKADEGGFIRGNTFVFSPKRLADFAECLVRDSLAKERVVIDNKYFSQSIIQETARILRSIAAGS